MVRYYFHTENGRCFPDVEGCDLGDLDAAKHEAVRVLGEILRDSDEFWETEQLRLLVSETAAAEDPLFVLEVRTKSPHA
jgi:hypothetical protein